MKKYILIVAFLFTPFIYSQDDIQTRLDNLEQTVLDLEIKSLFSKILFSGELTTNFSRENLKNYATAPTKRSNTLVSNTIKLNANSNIGKRIKVFTSLESSFFFGENLAESSPPSSSLLNERDGDHLRVTKAYFDYHLIPKSLITSLGRLPTTDGPPAHFYSLEDRLGTYALLTYSIPIDGAAVSWNISHTLDMKDSLIGRLIWGKGSKVNRDFPAAGLNASKFAATSSQLAEDNKYKSIMLEYSSKRFGFLSNDINFISHYIKGSLGRFAPYQLRGLAAGDYHLYEISYTDDELFSFDLYSMHLDMQNIFRTNFDFYLTHKITKLKSSGEAVATLIDDPDPTDSFGLGDKSPNIPSKFLGDTDKLTGYSTLLGARYKFTSNFALGAEYLKSTKGTLPTTSFTQAKTNIYNIIGKAYHTYITKTFFAKKVITRLGYTNSLSDFTISSSFASSTQRAESVYALITLKF